MIQKRFGLDIPVFVILQEKLEDILSKALDWWGTSDKDIYDNLIFVITLFFGLSTGINIVDLVNPEKLFFIGNRNLIRNQSKLV